MPLILALRRQRQADLHEFESSLVYRASSRTAMTVTQRNLVFKRTKNKHQSTIILVSGDYTHSQCYFSS